MRCSGVLRSFTNSLTNTNNVLCILVIRQTDLMENVPCLVKFHSFRYRDYKLLTGWYCIASMFICESLFPLIATSAVDLSFWMHVLNPKIIFNTQTFAFICGSWFPLIVTSAADLSFCKSSAAPCGCSGLHPDYELGDIWWYFEVITPERLGKWVRSDMWK